eukprot:CAMPEP_0197620812 /NCGR_PEP_ID=MMETSP1338-20131121/1553_1 /TAXON_ID=43686 ORGANISM="Pelagodinium beii, Strain RCC1491" /NCGR_SAMPLE_ID=MMETSP1338 /ASSEMBLY_ACC=CAM_ASM_000754 /LENGTH=104 /DNA_ID=CAMNT_0043190095 /DNA_START=92 /DNA_END=406 /DNA_ORIENTATION=+
MKLLSIYTNYLKTGDLDEAQLEDVFNAVDNTGDGQITTTEMEDMLNQMLPFMGMAGTMGITLPYTVQEMKSMIPEEVDKADADRDGQVSFTEFYDCFKAMSQAS